MEYEEHLEIFLEAGGDAHARHLYGEPVKPEGYDEYKKQQEEITIVQREASNNGNDSKNTKVIAAAEVTGYEFDKDGVPKFLTADDVYMGNVNPDWERSHLKPIENKTENIIKEPSNNDREGFDYDEDVIPAYLNAHDRHEGNVNPAWIAKHETKI